VALRSLELSPAKKAANIEKSVSALLISEGTELSPSFVRSSYEVVMYASLFCWSEGIEECGEYTKLDSMLACRLMNEDCYRNNA